MTAVAYVLKPSTFERLRQILQRGRGGAPAGHPYRHEHAELNRLGGVEYSCSLLPDGKTVRVLVGQIVWGPYTIRNGTRNGAPLPPYYFHDVDISGAGEEGKWVCVIIELGTDPYIVKPPDGPYYATFAAGVPFALVDGPDKPAHDVDIGVIRIPLSLWRMRVADPQNNRYLAERLVVAHVGRIDLTSFFLPPLGEATIQP